MNHTLRRVVVGSAAIALSTIACSDNPNLPIQGESTGELTMLNALPAGAMATLRIDGEAAALPATGQSGTAVLESGSHQFQIFNGAQMLTSKTITIAANAHRTAVLSGSGAQALLVVNTLDTAVTPLTDAVKLRLVHTVADAPSTDAFVFLVTQAADSAARFVFPFTFGTGTDPNFPGYGVRPPGEYRIWLKASGTSNVLVQGGPYTLNAGDVYSFVLAKNDAGAMELHAVKEH